MTARAWLRWELMLAVLILLAGAWAATLSPYYLYADQILYSLQQSIAIAGLLALGLTLVMLVGEIDISVPAILAMGTIAFSRMSDLGVPIVPATVVVVLIGLAAGTLNGVLVVAFGLPSLAVTLGMLGAYRAIALWFGGQQSYAAFRPDYIWLGGTYLGGVVPVSLLLLAAAAALFAFVVHGTVFGRLVYVVGSNAQAARLSGIRVAGVKVATYAIAGGMAGLAALVYIGQYESARADNASEILLFIIAAVVLGGIDIYGGRGTVAGVVLALLLLGTLSNGMGLANFPGPVQTSIIGALLVVSVLVPQLIRQARAAWPRRPPAPQPS